MAEFWSRVWSTLKRGGQAAGAGIQYVYRKGDENKHFVLPAVNGLVGDKLHEAGDPRAIQMRFRISGRDLAADDPEITQRLGKARTVALFVHGLMADEVFWQEPSPGEQGFGPRLEEAGDVACFYVRYNTGRHISHNGRELSALIETFYQKNRTSIDGLIIIAHSMGGLVSRSAGYYASVAGHEWTKVLKKVVLIGVPNDGSYLEKFGHLATFVLKTIWTIPTRIIGRIADERSSGIKDLRWGFLVDEDWQDERADDLVVSKRTPVPPIPGVEYSIIAGTLLDENAVISLYFGDGLVGRKSAAGEMFRRADSPEEFLEFRVFPGFGHIRLITADEVYRYIVERVRS